MAGMTTQASRITGLSTTFDSFEPPTANVQGSAAGGDVVSHPAPATLGDATVTRAPSFGGSYDGMFIRGIPGKNSKADISLKPSRMMVSNRVVVVLTRRILSPNAQC